MLVEIGGYTIQTEAIEAIGPVVPMQYAGESIPCVTVYLRTHALAPTFPSWDAARKERDFLLAMVTPPA